jgi:glutamate synthase domain-containing protein 1
VLVASLLSPLSSLLAPLSSLLAPLSSLLAPRSLPSSQDPVDSEPFTEQIFVINDGGKKGKILDQRKFERELMRIRKLSEDEAALQDMEGFYINSLTPQTITYKGQLTPEQGEVG